MDLQTFTGAAARRSSCIGPWEEWAACRYAPTGLFYRDVVSEEGSEARQTREAHAKSICAACLVRSECLEYALRIDEPLGVWGGLTGAERRQLD
jgi:WhiB family redox-sensing transcriptional regulator